MILRDLRDVSQCKGGVSGGAAANNGAVTPVV